MIDLRRKSLVARRAMSREARANASSIICKRVLESRLFFAAKRIACYLPMNDEVDTLTLIERGWRANKRIFVPVLIGRGKMLFREIRPETPLQRNAFDLWEPQSGDIISPRNLDLVLTPTVAYDKNNNRIGMGGGYFDRCFAFLRHRQHWLRPKLVGLAYSCQKVEKISPNVWDIRLYKVFSDSE
ncbi:MAG: 5-formyltetrahydrofolate cyclo-ligase [Woeseiaceae bacterium]